MTKEKASKMAKAALECMERDVSGCDETCNSHKCDECALNYEKGNMGEQKEWLRLAIKALGHKPRKGEWLRMSDLSEQEDDRYKCSRCGNVLHYKNKMDLYTFNSWCGRCGSDNGRKIEVEL